MLTKKTKFSALKGKMESTMILETSKLQIYSKCKDKCITNRMSNLRKSLVL